MDSPAIDGVHARAYTIPTDGLEQDGTADWDSATLVVCEVKALGDTGIGYTYGPAALTGLVTGMLSEVLCGRRIFDSASAWEAMGAAVRNAGRPGMAMMAVSPLTSHYGI